MDPLSAVAIAGLVFAGKALSERKSEDYYSSPNPPNGTFNAAQQIQTPPPARQANIYEQTIDRELSNRDSIADNVNRGQSELPASKQELPSFAVVTPTSGKNPYGQPVYNMYDRQNVSGKMNNSQPMEKQYVGAGIGVGPNVPAFGGYQQLYRVMPNNVGGYKLTTLPGRTGPANPVVKSQGKIGQLTQERPEKTAALFDRRPPVRGRAEGQGGALTGAMGRMNFEKTKRQTNRSTTTLRADTLGFGAASSYVPAQSLQDAPTRNKGDLNTSRINDVAAPGIYSFNGAYTQDAVLTTGIRPAVNRGNKDRPANAGRMNVRMDPLNQGGSLTAVRNSASTQIIGGAGPTGAGNQTYVKEKYQKNNAYKGNRDFRSCNLGLAKKQLANNPLNVNFS
tara:strand:- start:9325 stop:10506 length:1182 start_codon:yes stop_codon:yes gene_type:complete